MVAGIKNYCYNVTSYKLQVTTLQPAALCAACQRDIYNASLATDFDHFPAVSKMILHTFSSSFASDFGLFNGVEEIDPCGTT